MITSKDNEIIKQVSKLMSGAAYRREQQCFIAEGARLCSDGVDSHAKVSAFLYTKKGKEKYPKANRFFGKFPIPIHRRDYYVCFRHLTKKVYRIK